MPSRAPGKMRQPPVVRGAAWQGNPVRVCTDANATVPLNLTGREVWWNVGEVKLTDGAGLTISRAEGLVVPAMTAEQTAAIPPLPGKHALWVQTDEDPILVADTSIEVVNP